MIVTLLSSLIKTFSKFNFLVYTTFINKFSVAAFLKRNSFDMVSAYCQMADTQGS